MEDDVDKDSEERITFSRAQDVGKDVATDSQKFPLLAHRAMAFDGQNASWAFGLGLAEGTNNVQETWNQLLSISSEIESLAPGTLCGFMEGAFNRKPEVAQQWLDDVLDNEKLVPFIVDLSVSLPLNKRSLERLIKAIQQGKTPLTMFSALAHGRATDSVAQHDLFCHFFRNYPSPALREPLLRLIFSICICFLIGTIRGLSPSC